MSPPLRCGEGEEAAFFSPAKELAEQVRYHLAREEDRKRIAAAGHARITTAVIPIATARDRLLEIFQALTAPG